MAPNIPIWQAIVDGTGPVSCDAICLQSAALAVNTLIAAGAHVIALTDGEITLRGEHLERLLADPNAIHMHNSKVYDSSAELVLA